MDTDVYPWHSGVFPVGAMASECDRKVYVRAHSETRETRSIRVRSP